MLKTVLSAFVIECVNQTSITNAVIDQETSQMMECRHLITHKKPKTRDISNTSASNEMGRLFQGVGKGDDGEQLIKVTGAFFFISREKVPIKKSKRHHLCSCCVHNKINEEGQTQRKNNGWWE